MSLVSQLLTIASVFTALAVLFALPVWRMKRKAEASVVEIEGVSQQLKTAREVAAKHKSDCDRLQAETAEVFLAGHAREIRDHNEERAMELAESFVDQQKDALSLAFRTRMDEAIGQSPQDGAPAFEIAILWGQATLALTPRDRMLRALIDDLKNAAAIAGQSNVKVTLKDDSDRQTRLLRTERLPADIDALSKAALKARDDGHYSLMQVLAERGQTITRRPPFGEGSTDNLLFRRHRAEAMWINGQARDALAECITLAQPFQNAFGGRDRETLYLRGLQAESRKDSGDPEGALAEVKVLLPLRTEVQGARHPSVLVARFLQAQCYSETGDPERALAEVEALLPFMTEVQGARHPNVLATRFLQAQCRSETGDPERALAEVEALLPLRAEVQGPRHPSVLLTRFLQAQCRSDIGDLENALAEVEALLPLTTEVQGSRHPNVLVTRLLRAECLADLDKPQQAGADLDDIQAGFLAAGLLSEHTYVVRLNKLKDRLAENTK